MHPGRSRSLLAMVVTAVSASCAATPTVADRLLAATEAIGGLSSISYQYAYEGSGSVAGSFEGAVRIRRTDGNPLYWAELRPSPSWDPATDTVSLDGRPPALVLVSGGEHVAALDEARGKFSYGTVSGGSGHLVANAPFAVLFQLTQARPFEAELDGELALEGQETIGGVLCDVIRGTDSTFGDADVWWYIGVEDALPRAYRWVATVGQAEGEFFFQIRALDVEQPIPTQGLQISQRPGDEVVEEDVRRLESGFPAPDWELARPDGSSVRLSELRGSVIVLDFWASWCVPCRTLVPEYDRLAREFEGRGVRFFGLDTWESPEISAENALRDLGATYPVLLRAERFATDYRLSTLPALFVVDAAGNLALVRNPVTGDAADVARELERAIGEALEGNPC